MEKRICLVMLCLLLTGCTFPDTGSGKGETEREEVVELEFYTWTDEREYITEAVHAFMEEHPNIRVNLHFIPSSEYAQTISILHNSEERGIDVFAESKPSVAAADVERDYVLDITEMVEEDASYGGIADNLRIDGRIYMLPYRKSAWAVYYNKEIFDRAGVAYPAEDWTWEDYTETARKLTSGTGKDKIYGSMSFEINSMWWRTPARTAGMENRMTEETLEALEEAAEWNYRMAYEFQAQPAFTELTDVNSYDYTSRFLSGTCAMFYCGDWVMEMIDQQIEEKGISFDYDVAPLPGPEKGERYMPVTSAVLQISSRSEHPEEAYMLACYIAGEEGAEIFVANGIIPAYDSEKIRKILGSREEAPEHVDYFWNYGQAVYTQPNEKMEEALTIVNKYVGQYFMKEITLEEAFYEIETILEERELIEENGKEN